MKTEPRLSWDRLRGMWAGKVDLPDDSVWEPDPQEAIDFGIVDPET